MAGIIVITLLAFAFFCFAAGVPQVTGLSILAGELMALMAWAFVAPRR
jgi:hypothetical protein